MLSTSWTCILLFIYILHVLSHRLHWRFGGFFFLRRLLFSPCSLLADLFSIFMCFYHFFFFPDSNFSEFIWLFLESPHHCGNCCLSVLKIRCFFVLCVHAFFNFFPLMRFLMNPQTCHALWHLFLTYLLFPHL